MSSSKVLIVGAGPTGLGLALTLLQNGVSVRIIDKRPTYGLGLRGAGVMPRTLEAYNILGILPDMTNHAFEVPLMQFYELPGGSRPIRTSVVMPEYQATPAIPYPNALVVGQDMQEQTLRSHIAKYSCHAELNTELQFFEQHPDHVTATLVHHNGSEHDSTTEIAEFEYVVGSDGAHSTIRKSLGVEFPGKTYEDGHMVICDIQIKSCLDDGFWHAWGNPIDRMVTILPWKNRDGVFTVMMYGCKLDRVRVSSSREELIKEVYDITGRTDIQFGDMLWISQYHPNIRMVSKLRHDRVFLAGDAAHCHSHFGAQGMNAGFQDALNLGWKLALVVKRNAPQTLLDTCNEERIPVIKEMLEKAEVILQATFTPRDNSGREWNRGDDLRMLGVNCRKSSVIVDDNPSQAEFHAAYDTESATAAQAGDRAPDAPALHNLKDPSGPTSLFQLFRCYHHTIIVFSNDPAGHAGILAVCSEQPIGTIRTCLIVSEGTPIDDATKGDFDFAFCDKQGHAFDHYHISEAPLKVFAIRPDGVIGAAVNGVEGLRKYFSNIFNIAVSN
ncbi:FAD binding domain containing protein [Amanita muscaria]